MDFHKAFQIRLKQLIVENGQSLEEIAKNAKMDLRTLKRLTNENNVINVVRLKTAKQLCQGLGISFTVLLDMDHDINPTNTEDPPKPAPLG